MKLIEALAKTPKANKRFKIYYDKSNVSLTIPFVEFLKLDFRYQSGVFLDYLRKENIEANICHKGYILYVHSPNKMGTIDKAQEWVFHLVDEDWYYLAVQETTHEPQANTRDIQLQEVTKQAILKAFELIHAGNKGYNVEFDAKLIKP